ncbi:hypothetical protein H4R18_005648 [Coemansia javaensis]|uniref:Telomeric single stranded DNA binding POT1/Cdc13 domain-containing protein n=1 Tax=Coemansia javaensis TaxID=2761396 RepID=A0A9W8LDY7_9FUNG|nr:hypothetical protein H4R18_005648 [Coemansia javaensis]
MTEVGGITALGAGDGTAIATEQDYRHQLRRSMLTPLRDLQASRIISAIFVVVAVEVPRVTRGNDYLLALHAADPTTSRSDPVLVSIFRRSIEALPDIRTPGDIVYLDSVKPMMYRGRLTIFSHFSTYWQIHRCDAPVAGLHPIIAHLRAWWQGPDAASDPPRHQPRAAPDPPSHQPRAAAVSATATMQSPATMTHPASRIKSHYSRQMCDMEPDRFGDMVVEVVHVEPREGDSEFPGHMMQRCLVTDYTPNAQLQAPRGVPAASRIDGQCLAWCTIHQVDKINRMPPLEANRCYWMRGVKALRSYNHGMVLVLKIHPSFQRTILVGTMEDGHPDLAPLKARQQSMLRPPPSPALPGAMELASPLPVARGGGDNDAAAAAKDTSSAAVTPIAAIHASQQLNTRYRVRARITGIFPQTAGQCIVSVCAGCGARLEARQRAECPGCQRPNPTPRSECQLVVELADDSASCLAVCVDPGMSACGALRDLWLRVQGGGADAPWADVLVALMLVPGPGPSAGALTRCLVLPDASALL